MLSALQVAFVLGVALYHAMRRQWISALGILVGLIIGLSPLYFWRSLEGLLGPLSLFALIVVPVLTIAYAVGKRWLAASLALGLFCLLLFGLFSPATTQGFRSAAKEYGALIIFFVPLLASLASREVCRRLGAFAARA